MNFHSVAEILSSIEETRSRLVARVENLSEGQQSFCPAPDAWSVADIVEHLAVSETRMSQMLGLLVGKAEGDGHLLPESDGEPRLPAPVTIREHVERSLVEKYDAPEMIRPTGGVPLADSLERLRQTRAAVLALRPRIERVDGRHVRYPHPAFGPLDLYQWLAFVGVHEERHLRQIESILEAQAPRG
ncbi:MAG TPA: DinB family protein [Pyrinomonadaceae bacterium]|nr:DinB family protein [Pyrinomonadaceae bacterium]